MSKLLQNLRINGSTHMLTPDLTPFESVSDNKTSPPKKWEHDQELSPVRSTSSLESSIQSLPKLRKGHRFLQYATALRRHSENSLLTIITMPLPGPNDLPTEYFQWLDILSKDMPLTIFVRGTHVNVLTPFL